MFLTTKRIRSGHKYSTSAHPKTQTQLSGPYFVILTSVETPSAFLIYPFLIDTEQQDYIYSFSLRAGYETS